MEHIHRHIYAGVYVCYVLLRKIMQHFAIKIFFLFSFGWTCTYKTSIWVWVATTERKKNIKKRVTKETHQQVTHIESIRIFFYLKSTLVAASANALNKMNSILTILERPHLNDWNTFFLGFFFLVSHFFEWYWINFSFYCSLSLYQC